MPCRDHRRLQTRVAGAAAAAAAAVERVAVNARVGPRGSQCRRAPGYCASIKRLVRLELGTASEPLKSYTVEAREHGRRYYLTWSYSASVHVTCVRPLLLESSKWRVCTSRYFYLYLGWARTRTREGVKGRETEQKCAPVQYKCVYQTRPGDLLNPLLLSPRPLPFCPLPSPPPPLRPPVLWRSALQLGPPPPRRPAPTPTALA